MSITAEVTPLWQRLLVKPMAPGERTSGGLFVPQMVHDGTPFLTAEVLAVGNGRLTPSGAVVPLVVKEGDIVVFARTSGTRDSQIVWPLPSGEEAMLILEDHVCLVINKLPRVTGIVGADGKTLLEPAKAEPS